jgi:hypothetical protein
VTRFGIFTITKQNLNYFGHSLNYDAIIRSENNNVESKYKVLDQFII